MLPDHFVIGILIFIISYIAIVSEKINRTIVALFGATLMILFHVLSQSEALGKIDFNTLGLLVGMMMIVNIIKRTGLFQYLAIKTAKLAKGEPLKIIVYFSIITAISSGLLDNVTTILLIVPVSLVIAETLKINPLPFIIAEIMSANIGGAATSIGDPTIIMISSATGNGFIDFIVNLLPLMIVIFIVTILLIRFFFRKSLHVEDEYKQDLLKMNEKLAITDKVLLIKGLIVLGITILGFTLAELIDIQSATVAIFGGSLLLLISKHEPEEILSEVEWITIFFFGGLFILVGSLEKIGFITMLSDKMLAITQGDIPITTMLVLWMSAILSSFLDNVPYVATMIPLVKSMEAVNPGDFAPVWWALAVGGCLGGNGTIIGASANVVSRGIAERNGFKISFFGYLKIAFPLMIISIIISSLYLFLVYL